MSDLRDAKNKGAVGQSQSLKSWFGSRIDLVSISTAVSAKLIQTRKHLIEQLVKLPFLNDGLKVKE